MKIRLGGLALVIVLACAKEQPSSQAAIKGDSGLRQVAVMDSLPGTKPTVQLVDTTISGIESEAVAKIEVRFGTAVDTIPNVLTFLKPLVTNDGVLHGIAMTDEGVATEGFDYDPRTKLLTRFPLPADLNGSFSEIEINADARFVAYVAHTEVGGTWAVVRSWPGLSDVMRTATSEGYPSDVGYDQVKWLDQNRFQISYRIRSGAIISVEGDVRTRTMKVDTATTGAS